MKVFLFLFALSPLNGEQRWAEEPSSVFVNPGGSTVLSCVITDKGGDCRWEKRTLGGLSVPVGIYPGKYEWAGDTEEGDCSLRIREADYHYDNGRWVCQVTASSFKDTDTLISREATVSVRGQFSFIRLVWVQVCFSGEIQHKKMMRDQKHF